jgi:hypothetical protein
MMQLGSIWNNLQRGRGHGAGGVVVPVQGTHSSLSNRFHLMLQELHNISNDSGDHVSCHDLAHGSQGCTGLELIGAADDGQES